jgi:hypothetical protein
MIQDVIPGDITNWCHNKRDIIIGMNDSFIDVYGIGKPFVANLRDDLELPLGSVLNFNFGTRGQKLHMILCHKLGQSGWKNAEQHVRFALDFLHHHNDTDRKYSIVQIGKGRIGKRDGADYPAIHRSIADSYLPLNLFVFDAVPIHEVVSAAIPLRALSAWVPMTGARMLEAA